jgi:hypothetical protein
VAKGNRTSVEVHLILTQSKDLHVCQGNDTEGLVDLKGINGALLNTGMLQGFWDREGRGRGELGRVLCCVAPAEDLADRGEVVFLESGFGDEDEG